jgi:type VI secretion system protein ImpH
MPFFALVEHLERVVRPPTPVGAPGPVAGERIFFRHDVRPVFHARDVQRFDVSEGSAPLLEITTTFLGLLGARSPLPSFATDDVLAAEAHGDDSVRAFYDVLHHRLVGLAYRALRLGTLGAERLRSGDDLATARLTGFAGLPPGLGEDELGGRRAAHGSLAPLLLRRPRSRAALEARLRLVAPELPFRVHELTARTVRVPAEIVSRLGEETMRLGETALLGDELVQQPGLVLVATGPVGRADFEALLPGQPRFRQVRAAVLSATAGTLEAELTVTFLPGAEPTYVLGEAPLGVGTVLGGEWDGVRSFISARIPLTDDGREPFEIEAVRR